MSARPTLDVVRHLLDIVAEVPMAEPRAVARDALCASALALLRTLDDESAVLALRRACHAVALARDEAIIVERPGDAALLDAALRVGSAVELLAEHEEDEARGYAGAALMPLAQARVFFGWDANEEDALSNVKSDLKTRLRAASL